MNKTPNALPPTILSLGLPFDCSAITLPLAREVGSIGSITIGSTSDRAAYGRKDYYPYHIVDFYGRDGKVLMRSKDLRISKSKLISLKRQLVRKLAVYLFENQDK